MRIRIPMVSLSDSLKAVQQNTAPKYQEYAYSDLCSRERVCVYIYKKQTQPRDTTG